MTYYNDNTCAWTKYYTVRVVVSSFGGFIMYSGHQTDFIRMDYLIRIPDFLPYRNAVFIIMSF